MITIVLILGTLVLFIVGVIALVRIYLKRQAIGRLAAIPARITVNPTAHPNWRNADKEEELTATLRALQFYEVGAFSIPELHTLMKGFLRPEDRVTAALFEHPEAGVWADLRIQYENGNSLTVSNAPCGGELEKMPGHEKIIDRDLTLVQMIELLEERRNPETARFVTPVEIPELIRAAYARDYDWHKHRGGPKAHRSLPVSSKMEQGPVLQGPVLPCVNGPCPYEYGKDSDRQIEGMPFPTKAGDRRACPIYGHLCPEFMEELGLTVEDLRIRATIHSGTVADEAVKKGKLGKDSREYRELRSRCQEIMAEYPAEQYPQYYR